MDVECCGAQRMRCQNFEIFHFMMKLLYNLDKDWTMLTADGQCSIAESVVQCPLMFLIRGLNAWQLKRLRWAEQIENAALQLVGLVE
mmetsp:Transcript_47309/g.84925  ORF Transcript_47309/g.84925 Transcript_47309/m.84925 type:complete len:87 (-) Transcript_47309:84-344(-)